MECGAVVAPTKTGTGRPAFPGKTWLVELGLTTSRPKNSDWQLNDGKCTLAKTNLVSCAALGEIGTERTAFLATATPSLKPAKPNASVGFALFWGKLPFSVHGPLK